MTLGVALIVIIVLFFLVKSEGFRKAASILLGVCVLGGFVIYAYFENEKAERARKLARAKTLVTMDEIALLDPQMRFSTYDGRPEKITGRLRNNSKYTVESVELHLLFQDCPTNAACETIGTSEEDVSVDVPPGQSRDFDSYVSGNRMSPRGKLNWNYSIKSITAHLP